ncbi:YbaB/EbfC family nucleoid-associated protein [Nocardia sp. CDC153]|uniref:YbaB/EbfC family nucleoid-associated protein n=1 Tax=Nocardia sp. CDC153 TaxID=3112167 RepID=UPI002DBEED49|nr:YbaB/EbfC family nucleoid-associated protein [Nocardia sp. CDC153]MEC3954478.1 YbaB/EbfC family nucleoid-associated protein [Nocardia sp. CDC153]
MTNERAKAEMADLLDEMRWQMAEVARIQRERAGIVGRATIRKRVTVTTDANGVVTDVRFSSGIQDLDYPEIADAVVRAAAEAAADAARQVRELMADFQRRRTGLPTLSDLVPGAPDVRTVLPPITGTLPRQSDSPQPLQEDAHRDPRHFYGEAGW